MTVAQHRWAVLPEFLLAVQAGNLRMAGLAFG